jgi:hypothetical protein
MPWHPFRVLPTSDALTLSYERVVDAHAGRTSVANRSMWKTNSWECGLRPGGLLCIITMGVFVLPSLGKAPAEHAARTHLDEYGAYIPTAFTK